MNYTRWQWCYALLRNIGNRYPTSQTLAWVIAWTKLESMPPGASYNLLNTTQREPGSTDFNSVGVQNFVSFTQGIQANTQVLENGLYNNLLQALHTNTLVLPLPLQIDQELNTWCGGCNYGPAIAQHLGQGANDLFPGDASNFFKQLQFYDLWNASGLRNTTGIFKACLNAFLNHGVNFGMPTHDEIITTDWQGNKRAIQPGSHGLHAEYDYATGKTHFYTVTNVEVLVI